MPNRMFKRDVLRELKFGSRVAEEEIDHLTNYFVETEQWRKLYAGEADIVYGAKGSGKSALYYLLIAKAGDLFDRGVIVIPAENPAGAPVFKGLVSDPPTTEQEFISLWKLYFLSLIGETLRDYQAPGDAAATVKTALAQAGLLQDKKDLRALLRACLDYVRRMLHSASVEVGIDPSGRVTGGITLGEPAPPDVNRVSVSLEKLYELADEALSKLGAAAWLVLDRLDVAFAETSVLEENALRALFRAYRDVEGVKNIRIKIFLRTDLWKIITAKGFREASHIIRTTTIKWDEPSLMNLMARRVVQNDAVLNFYGVDADYIMQSLQRQYDLFYLLFPGKVSRGGQNPLTHEWMLVRTRDGLGENAPRELIHLLTASRDEQLQLLLLGEQEPKGDELFSPIAIERAMSEVSKVRLEQTLFAEYPSLRASILRLMGEVTPQNTKSLARIWQVSREEASVRARQLVEVGFFESGGSEKEPEFSVPFLYRYALNMV